MGLRRVTSVGALIAVTAVMAFLSPRQAFSQETCYFDPLRAALICEAAGGGDVAPAEDRPPLRYLYTATAPGIGDCRYWSAVAGGLDAWDPANDPAVIAITTSLPECPAEPDPEATAWAIFRSFPLAVPDPSLEPAAAGITGLPTYLVNATPDPILYSEVLPDGRTLQVRATAALLIVDWGDGVGSEADPGGALPHPAGSVTHVYLLKTCEPSYREEHPFGGGCHPTLEAYPLTVSLTWVGEWSVGSTWNTLGTLDRTVTLLYDVDEVRGVLQP